jgi:adenylosuccinate lyase
MTMDELLKLRDPKLYIGRCPEQVDAFLNECVRPLIAAHKDDLEVSEVELKV